MIERQELALLLKTISKHWAEMADDPDSKPMQGLPRDFWMNSRGGRVGKGYWVTTIMYTEDEEFAGTFKEVLAKWQSGGMNSNRGPDLIQIGKKS